MFNRATLAIAAGILAATSWSQVPVIRAKFGYGSPASVVKATQQLVGQRGTILTSDAHSMLVEVRANDPEQILEAIHHLPGITTFEPIAPRVPSQIVRLNSRSEVNRLMNQFKVNKEAFEELVGEDEAEKRIGETDYLDAYQYFLERHAYPNDSIDWNAMSGAEAQRSLMPGAYWMRQQGPGYTLSGGWEFQGPKNLDIPYQIYYGVPPLGGRTNAVAFDPTNGSTIYMGAAQGGLWKSTNAGVNWTNLSFGWPNQRINAIKVNPLNGNVIYVGTGDIDGGLGPGFGIHKSTDGGQTWTIIGANEFGGKAVRGIAIDPEDPNTILVAPGWGNNPIYKSTDAGASWTAVTIPAPVQRNWYNIVVGAKDSVSGNRPYYAIADGQKVVRSTDKGATWTDLTLPVTVGHADIAASPVNSGNVYVVDNDSNAIYKSTDQGATWTNTTNNFPGGYNWSQGWYDIHIECSNNGNTDVVYVGLIDLCQSADGGATWINAGRSYFNDSKLHNDQHSLAINPQNPNQCLVGNDGGTFMMNFVPSQNSVTFTSLNRELGATTLLYNAAFHPTDPRYILGGTQDNAAPAAIGNLDSWDNPGAGDGAYQAINQQNPANQYTSWQFLSISRTNNYWQSAQGISPNTSGDNVPFIGVINTDVNNGNYLYACTNYLDRYDNTTGQWTYHLGGQDMGGGSTISAVSVAPGHSTRIYVGSRGKAFMSNDFGTSFTDITGNLPNRYVQDIAVDPNNQDNVWVTLSGSGSGHVYHCINASSTPPVWTDISGSGGSALPNAGANSIALDPDSPTTSFYVGTDVGVFATEDAGATWSNATEALGLPGVTVTKVATIAATKTLFAATHGRGIWSIGIGINLLSSFTISPTAVTGGTTDATGIVRLTAVQPNDIVFNITASPSSTVVVPATITVPAGQIQASFPIQTRPVVDTTVVRITINGEFGNKTSNLTVRPVGLADPLEVLPGRIAGGNAVTGIVHLAAGAPVGGASVYITTTRPDLAWPERNWIVIPEGQNFARFRIFTKQVTGTELLYVQANRAGVRIQNDLTLLKTSISSLTATPSTLRGGNISQGKVTLDAPAGVNGAIVRLTSSDTTVATVPSTIVVPPGYRTLTFNITTKPQTTSKQVVINSTYGSSTKDVTVTVNP